MLWGAAELGARVEADRAAATGTPPARDSVALVAAAVEALPSDGPFLTALQRQARADLARAEHTDTADTWAEVRGTWLDLGHIPSTGWACLRLAGAHVRTGDRRSAEAPLGEAWQIAERLGAAPLRDAVVDLARGARIPLARPSDSTRPTSGPLARLTERELEVLRHVAAGRSNDEIAEALFISPKTASVHVSRILVKLDVTTRTKAAAFAYGAGLVTLPSSDMSPRESCAGRTAPSSVRAGLVRRSRPSNAVQASRRPRPTVERRPCRGAHLHRAGTAWRTGLSAAPSGRRLCASRAPGAGATVAGVL